ncbi:MAG: nucleoid occlusion protein [Firmicutes bacterium]|nr:nucleoid occlusion protein [Bacillota bacterium]
MRETWSKVLGLNEREATSESEVMQIPVEMIRPNRYQPRSVFDDAKLDELAMTIRTHGVIQPILVRKLDTGYELVAGERRWRAAQKIGMDYIPAIVRALSDAQAASMALIENLQREGLTAIEEAAAYQQLIELHHLTQESLAQRLGKGQSTVANKLRLLHLSAAVQEAIRERKVTERHARALLPLTAELQEKVLEEIVVRELNVKQTEQRVAALMTVEVAPKKVRKVMISRDSRLAINTIRESLKLIGETGLQVEADEEDRDEFIVFTIRVPKRPAQK